MKSGPNEERMRELSNLLLTIPRGRVVSYGLLGRLLTSRVSGLVVGNWMKHFKIDVPWWRVVGANGELKTGRFDPALEIEQRHRLEQEGVEFEEDVIPRAYFLPQDELLEFTNRHDSCVLDQEADG